MNIDNNNGIAFNAKLTYLLDSNPKRWDRVAKKFSKETFKTPNYELIFSKNSKDEIILSTFDGNEQKAHILSKKGFELLNKLSDNGIVSRLKSVLNITKKAKKAEDNFVNALDKAGMSQREGDICFDLYEYNANRKMQENFEKMNVFKNNIETNVSFYRLD